jgi:hypothetical protein
MTMTEREPETLCYVGADKVDSPVGTLAGMNVRTQDDKKLGTIDGVLIDPELRRVLYFVVSSHPLMRRRRYKVRADVPAQIDAGQNELRMEAAADDLPREEFDVHSARTLSGREVDAVLSLHAAA